MKKEFSTLRVSFLQINDIHSLVHSTVEAASVHLTPNNGPLIDASLAVLKSYDVSLGMLLHKSRKSPHTAKILEIDKARTLRWREIRATVNTICKSHMIEKREEAALIKLFIKPYWKLDKLPLNTKTDQINLLLTNLQNSGKLVGLCQKHNIYELLISLSSINSIFDELYKQRVVEEGAKTGPSATSLRVDTMKSYHQFCTLVEQTCHLTPNESIIELFNTMDELRKKYTPLVNKPTSKATVKAKISILETTKVTPIISVN